MGEQTMVAFTLEKDEKVEGIMSIEAKLEVMGSLVPLESFIAPFPLVAQGAP